MGCKITGFVRGVGIGKIFVNLYLVCPPDYTAIDGKLQDLFSFHYTKENSISLNRRYYYHCQVVCNAKGKFEFTHVPAGRYSLFIFEDANANGIYDSNIPGLIAEPYTRITKIDVSGSGVKEIPEITLENPCSEIPEIVWDEKPELIELYKQAWKIARSKIARGSSVNGFVDYYMDEGFNDHIFQWDTCLMMLFGMYGGIDVPSMPSIDNFYRKQKADGFICRVYSKVSGKGYLPTLDDPHINPPIFVWSEYRYYQVTGDDTRLIKAFHFNHRYFKWIEANCRRKEGYYFTTNFGSGMDNSPREGYCFGWIDITAQMAIFALYLSRIAEAIGYDSMWEYYRAEYEKLREFINRVMWDKESGFYYDIRKDGSFHRKKTAASFWTLLGEIPSAEQIPKLVRHLKNPFEFGTPHRFASLSKDEPEYTASGYYWRGSVWPPINYMIIKGLRNYGFEDYAYESALNHISIMSDIYRDFVPESAKLPYDEDNVPFPRTLDGSGQIWESYCSESKKPATRWDKAFYVRPEFVGWSGLGPIALMIEDVLGLELCAPEKKIVWRIHTEKKCGIKGLRFMNGTVNLTLTDIDSAEPNVQVESTVAFELEIRYKEKIIRKDVAI